MSTASHTNNFSTFQSIFDAAFQEYEKKTGQDLRAHPFAAQLDRCDSTDGVLDIFQKQADALNETGKCDQTLMKWLNPTVHLLHTLSATISGAVGVVSLPTARDALTVSQPINIRYTDILSGGDNIYWSWRSSQRNCRLGIFSPAFLTSCFSGGKGCRSQPWSTFRYFRAHTRLPHPSQYLFRYSTHH